MPTVAEQLRAARLAKGLSIEQVAETTKMRSDQVRALEEANFTFFSAPVYLRGSIRTYATLLKLEVPPLLNALDQELHQAGIASEPGPRPASRSGILDHITLFLSKLDWRKSLVGGITALVILLSLVGYLAWRSGRNADPLQDLEPGIYKPKVETGPSLPIPGEAQR